MARLRIPPRGDRDAGQAATDYMGILVVLVTVVALVGAVLVFPGGSPIASTIKTGVCTIAGLGCSGDDGSGSTSGSGSQPGAGSQDDHKDDGCHGFWGCAWSGVKQVGSGVYNIGKGAVDDVTGLVGLIAHPSRIIDAGDYAIHHPLDTLKQLIWDDETSGMWDRGDYGGAVGREIWNIGSLFIPGVDAAKVVAKVGDVGRIAARLAELAKIGDKAADAARLAERAAARGDVKAAEAAARDARKAADDAAARARAIGCPIALGIPLPGPGAVLALAPEQPAGPGLFAAPVSNRAAFIPLASDCGDAADAARKADADADAAEKAAKDAETNASALVPGGGLQAHETAGGHTLDRHVGKTDQDLIDRLAQQPNISAASTFTDRAAAEAADSAAIANNSAAIQSWLKGSSNANLPIVFDTGSTTGRSAARGATSVSDVQDVTGVRVVLKKAPGTPLGYYILTSYPERIP